MIFRGWNQKKSSLSQKIYQILQNFILHWLQFKFLCSKLAQCIKNGSEKNNCGVAFKFWELLIKVPKVK